MTYLYSCRLVWNTSFVKSSGNEKEQIRLNLFLKRVMGIEPTYPAWKAGVLPLNYTRRWCPVPESNQRHEDFQSSALPTELTGRFASQQNQFYMKIKPVSRKKAQLFEKITHSFVKDKLYHDSSASFRCANIRKSKYVWKSGFVLAWPASTCRPWPVKPCSAVLGRTSLYQDRHTKIFLCSSIVTKQSCHGAICPPLSYEKFQHKTFKKKSIPWM